MKALVVDGFKEAEGAPRRFHEALTKELQRRGYDVEYIRPAEHTIAWCHGEFNCWVKTPGICMSDDMNREIARKTVESDLLVYSTPITFGGYSWNLKKALDHQIQNIMPFFTRVGGEVHHTKRYSKWPSLAVFGMAVDGDDGEQETFRALVHRNAINMRPPACACGITSASATAMEMERTIHHVLETLESGREQATSLLAQDLLIPEAPGQSIAPEQVLLLVGSPRGLRSSSNSIVTYMTDRLAQKGIKTKTIVAVKALHSTEGIQELCTEADLADLVVVAYPLYVDSLAAPLTRALEEIALHRRSNGLKKGRLVAIANCGFPESSQNRVSLAICRNFARRAGYSWAGGLALGAGEGVVQQSSLADGGGRTRMVRRALDLATDALAAGMPIPVEAESLFSRTVIPSWLYLLIGQRGWKRRAKEHGAERRIWDRPYEVGNASEDFPFVSDR